MSFLLDYLFLCTAVCTIQIIFSRYVNEVVGRDELPADATMGRQLMDIVNTATTHMQSEKLDSLVKNALRVRSI